MATILLIHPRTQHEEAYKFFYVPYSLLSLATVLISDFKVIVLDENVSVIDENSLQEHLRDNKILCVGITSMIGNQIKWAIRISKLLKKIDPKIPIVWGGAVTTCLPEETLSKDYVDIITIGQGHETFKQIAWALLSSNPPENITGIGYKSASDNLIYTKHREYINWERYPNFESVFHLIKINPYIQDDPHINTRTINYHSSQGCAFSCGFCSEVALWSRKWSGFSAGKIISDIEFLKNTYSINGIKFYDAEFFIQQSRSLEFASELIKRKVDIQWAAAIHPMNFHKLDQGKLELLAASGLRRVLIGAESESDEELKFIHKKSSKQVIIDIARRASDWGIHVCFSFVTGYPGSSLSQIDKTLDFARQLREIDSGHECKVHLYGPYPKTPLYELAINEGFIPPSTLEEWSDFDYYKSQTPWVPMEYNDKIRSFNEDNYIYMQK